MSTPELLANLALRVKEQEVATRYLLQMIAYLVKPDNPEHAYNHFAARQADYVADAPELSTMRSVVEALEQAKRMA